MTTTFLLPAPRSVLLLPAPNRAATPGRFSTIGDVLAAMRARNMVPEAQIAKKLKVHPSTIGKMRRDGRIKGSIREGRVFFLPADTVLPAGFNREGNFKGGSSVASRREVAIAAMREKGYLSERELARQLNVCTKTIGDMRRKGRLKASVYREEARMYFAPADTVLRHDTRRRGPKSGMRKLAGSGETEMKPIELGSWAFWPVPLNPQDIKNLGLFGGNVYAPL